MQNQTKSNQFCQEILYSNIRRSRSTTNLIMALASFKGAQSPTELSLSPVYQYKYGSISKAIGDLARNKEERKRVQQLFQSLCYPYFSPAIDRTDRVVFQTDTTPLVKAYSETLSGRTYIPIPNNVIPGNKPLGIGYEVSFINLSEGSTKWSLPLSIQRVETDKTASETALEQLKELLSHPDLGLSQKLCLNTLDSKYGNAAYMAKAFAYEDLVSILRLRSAMKVWSSAEEEEAYNGNGAPRIYGEKYYLISKSRMKSYKKHPKTGLPYEVYQQSIFERPHNDYYEIEVQTNRGRKMIVQIFRWDDLRIRSKNGNDMKDKPLDILAIKVQDAQSGKAVFNRDMFVAISGKRKDEISTTEGYHTYRSRYDIEPAMRFAKQRLLVDKLQTPKLESLDNWFLIYQMAVWLLYIASDEADFRPRDWRKYLPENQEVEDQYRLSIAQTWQAIESLFLTFDLQPFKPLKSKKGRPRQKGEKQIQRTRYEVVKKTSNQGENKKIP